MEMKPNEEFQAGLKNLGEACTRLARAIEGQSRGDICCPRCGCWVQENCYPKDMAGKIIMCFPCADKLIPGFSQQGWQNPEERWKQIGELLEAMVKAQEAAHGA